MSLLEALRRADPLRSIGRIEALTGSLLVAGGVQATLGEYCRVLSRQGRVLGAAVVVGFRGEQLLLSPFDKLEGVSSGCAIEPTGTPLGAPVGDGLLGRTIDALGRPADGGRELRNVRQVPVDAAPPAALARPRIREALVTGIRAIDTAITLGKGQRVGIFSGSGVGKSTLLGMLARGSSADRTVIALVGERGREVREFVEDNLGAAGLERTVMVVTTSDEPAVRKVHAVATACRIAEHFRDQGLDVLLLVDSITRVAMAQREVGLEAGEPPTTRGYTPSVFSLIPRLMERAGTAPQGSITGLYTVLVEGDDLDEPVADHMRSILDGHIVLSRALAQRDHYPAIDLLASKSRVMSNVVDGEHQRLAGGLRQCLASYAEVEDLVRIGAYREGNVAEVDRAVRLHAPIQDFLRQPATASFQLPQTLAELTRIIGAQSAQGGNE